MPGAKLITRNERNRRQKYITSGSKNIMRPDNAGKKRFAGNWQSPGTGSANERRVLCWQHNEPHWLEKKLFSTVIALIPFGFMSSDFVQGHTYSALVIIKKSLAVSLGDPR